MKTHSTKMMKQVVYVLLAAMVLMACFSLKALAADRRVDDIKDGVYHIKAINGNAKGKYLYLNEAETDVKKQLQFTANGQEANSQWLIKKDPKHSGCYFIYLSNKSPYRITMDRPLGTTALYCTMPERAEKLFCFYRKDDSTDYNNLTISPFYNKDYKFTRTKEASFAQCYLNAVKGEDSKSRKWKLEPVGSANELDITVKALKVKASALKKKKQTIALSKVVTVSSASGAAKIQISPETTAKVKKNFKINKAGTKLTIKKGTKKGNYSVKLIVSGMNSANQTVSQTVTLKVKVK